MKAKHTILLIALGFCFDFVTRILPRSEAHLLLVIATILKVLGVLLLAWKVVRYEGFRKFMER
jgi:hypothetical protein